MGHVNIFHVSNTHLCLFPMQHVQNFLLQVSGDRLTTALFQLAICGGSLAVPQDLVLKDKASKPTGQSKKEDKSTTSLPCEGITTGYTVFLSHAVVTLISTNDIVF